jgi:plastocyanin
MKRLSILAFCMGCAVLSLFSLGCPTIGPQYPVQYGPATPTPPPAVAVTLTGTSPANYAFNPSTVTVAPSGSITFIDQTTGFGSSHVLLVDNGAGTCLSTSTEITVPMGGSIVVTAGPFAVAGTYHYHCIYHSPCGTSSCAATCTGMAGVVTIP